MQLGYDGDDRVLHAPIRLEIGRSQIVDVPQAISKSCHLAYNGGQLRLRPRW